jgi:hypothetical protein
MSSIITNTILTNYPVAGIDNDSQGFRDNFLRIKAALDQAKVELQLFESRAVLKSTLDNSPVPVSNDIGGSTIRNGYFNTLYGTSYTGTMTTDVATVDLTAGIMQQLTLTINGNTTLTFVNWPATGHYASVRVHLTIVQTVANGVDVVNFTTQNNGHVIKDISFPTTLHVARESFVAVEAWTFDAGATVFLRYLGKYVKV